MPLKRQTTANGNWQATAKAGRLCAVPAVRGRGPAVRFIRTPTEQVYTLQSWPASLANTTRAVTFGIATRWR
jgi:hypothetical protein